MNDDELRDRLRRRLADHEYGSLEYLNYAVSNAIHKHAPVAVTEEQVKARLVVLWLSRIQSRVPWWRRPLLWWRLWRETR